MGRIAFTVEGPLRGYRASVTRHNAEYAAYKTRVLVLAEVAGWKGRTQAEFDWPVKIAVEVWWSKRPRIDLSNVYKAVEDALFADDTFVVGMAGVAHPFAGVPERAEVVVEWRPRHRRG